MSNGITTASGEVVVRGEEEERGCLGVCMMLECERERKMGTGDGEKGHLESLERAKLMLNGSVARNDGAADVRLCWTSFSEQTLTNTAKRRRRCSETERQTWNKEDEMRRNARLASRCQMLAGEGMSGWRNPAAQKSCRKSELN
ncbi:hypothetical protein D4764_10G0000240 [Takifugu flavidus]|uniref:Uncharacterized protein n=1 Tax=Takifugu flavidus TaxID=433684 RepID=A0A5C6PGP0_9TELE|nr:hypothetical protein D4764_10G0000240 [Takifugu flavidus]